MNPIKFIGDLDTRVFKSTIRMESLVSDNDNSNEFNIDDVNGRFVLRTRPNARVRFGNTVFQADSEGNLDLGEVDEGVYRVSVNDSDPEPVIMARESESLLPAPLMTHMSFYNSSSSYNLHFEIDFRYETRLGEGRNRVIATGISTDIDWVVFSSDYGSPDLPPGEYWVEQFENDVVESERSYFNLPFE